VICTWPRDTCRSFLLFWVPVGDFKFVPTEGSKPAQDARNRTLAVHEHVNCHNLGALQVEGLYPRSQPRATRLRPESESPRILAAFQVSIQVFPSFLF